MADPPARVNVDLTITNIDKVLEEKSPEAFYFNPWAFQKSIRESLLEVIATVKEKTTHESI